MSKSTATIGQTILRALGGGLIAALLGGVVGLAVPRTYTTSAVLLFPGSSSSGGSAGEVVPAPDTDAGAGAAPAGPGDQPSLPLMQGVLSVPQPGTSPATAGLILKSRKITTQLIRQFRLDQEWGLPLEEAILRFQREFTCITSGIGVLQIIYTDRSAERARDLVDTAIQLLTASVEELSLDPAGRNLRLLRESLSQAEADTARAQERLVGFQRKLGGIPPDTQLQIWGQTYNEIQRDLLQARVEGAVARTNADAVTHQSAKMIRAGQDPSGGTGSLLANLYRDVLDRERALALLREKYTDRRPEVVQARQELEAARRTLDAEMGRQLAAIREGASPLVSQSVLTAETSATRVARLQEAARAVEAKLEALPAAQATYDQLLANLRAERARLNLVRGEYVKAQLIAQSRGPQFVLLDPPVVPQRPNGYSPLAYAAVGFLVAPLVLAIQAARSVMRYWSKII